ncbi:hypothetical protein ABG768_006469, partial [Culter alburnus]
SDFTLQSSRSSTSWYRVIAERVHVVYDLMQGVDCKAAGAERERVFFGVMGASEASCCSGRP